VTTVELLTAIIWLDTGWIMLKTEKHGNSFQFC